jgi:DNA-directed RNA polymerase subunit RPC12/RpoP
MTMSIVEEIRCSNCGAPLSFSPGEMIATCRYCGFTQIIETGKAFELEHSMILNRYKPEQINELVDNWMRRGFLKPGDLAKASKILEKNLTYLPFWMVSVAAKSIYKGIFERLTPPIVKDGKIEKQYNWLVLARKGIDFPTREYEVPLEGKIPYDFKRIESFAKVLNSEIERDEAVKITKQQIDNLHQFLVKQNVDKIIELKTDYDFGNTVYLHTPIWLIVYEYKRGRYRILLDGSSGTITKGEIPTTNFGLI